VKSDPLEFSRCAPITWLIDVCVCVRSLCAGMYNNFFVASVRFWRSAAVTRFLRYVDASGFIYTRRYGDLPLQSVAVQVYLPKGRVHMFTDFSYCHGTTVSRASYLAQRAAQQQQQQQQSLPGSGQSTNSATGARAGGKRAWHRRHAAAEAQVSAPLPSSARASAGGAMPPQSGSSIPLHATATDVDVDAPHVGVVRFEGVAQGVASNSSMLPSDCINFGGVAAGTDDPSGYARVRTLSALATQLLSRLLPRPVSSNQTRHQDVLIIPV
jgi:hypothetical protein